MKDRRNAKTKLNIILKGGVSIEMLTPHTLEELDQIYKNSTEMVHWDMYEKANEVDSAVTRLKKSEIISYTVFTKNELGLVEVGPGSIAGAVRG